MSRIKVYMKPYADDLGTAFATSWVDVTSDAQGFGDLTQALDNTDYDVGVFRAQNMKLTMRNESGNYSPVGELYSIFKFTRGGSLVKITWEPGNYPLYAGFFNAGDPDAIVSEEVTMFEGILNDTATKTQLSNLSVDFQIMGYDSLLAQMTLPTINNGDTVATTIYNCINQSPFNTRVTVTLANITVSNAITIEDKTKMVNMTVLEALKQLLVAGNAVLYIRDGVVYVSPRTVNSGTASKFYGPASLVGIENIVDIKNYASGEARILNYWTWDLATSSVLAQDATSVAQYGAQKKTLKLDWITSDGQRTTILTSLKNEFYTKKREMDLVVPITPTNLAMFLLDPVSIDFPPLTINVDSQPVAYYGIGSYAVNYYANNLNMLTIESTATFKVMSRKINLRDETMTFSIREV